MKNHDAAAE
jgi:2-polyprenyl-3-methyl-5-hydroxy-6-metoxy-1,4-benzoquinol methylase